MVLENTNISLTILNLRLNQGKKNPDIPIWHVINLKKESPKNNISMKSQRKTDNLRRDLFRILTLKIR
jgi:hypothetical protein